MHVSGISHARTATFNHFVLSLFLSLPKGCRIVESSKGQYKIESIFDMTRAFGFHGDKSVKRFICSVPSVKSIKIDKNCAAVVLGTKGLWNTLSYKKVANLVLQASLLSGFLNKVSFFSF